jgi:hypothetical protein
MTNRLTLLAVLCAGMAAGHPMGNFSVNHYTRFEPGPNGLAIRYVMDLAEIPTFELFQQWGPNADPQKQALRQAREWAANLAITVAGRPVKARVERAGIVLAEGAGNMQVARITADLRVDAPGGAVTFEDRNYQGRSGWKEVVAPGATDRSAGLTAYPQDPMLAPPQDVKASFLWKAAPAAPVVAPRVETVAAPAAPAVTVAPAVHAAPGTVVKGDYLSTLLHRDEIGWQLTLI